MERKFRIHVLGVPHTITNEDFLACAFTQKALKFCKMMKDRGHTVFHYGHEDSNTMADEDVTVITNKAWEEVYGTHDYKNKLFKYNTGDKAYQEFFKNAIAEIEKRKQPNDIVLPFWGSGVRPICDAHEDIHIIEPGIGYSGGHWAPFKVFESYAILHAYQGLANVGECHQGNYDIVIPNYFDLDHFEYEENKDDYFLYLGRVYEGKGIHIAIQITDAAGVKLKVAGQPDETYTDYDWPDHVEFVGYAGVEERKELMKNAKGSLLPSQYLEPFGGVQIENLLAGTPTITADWGAFAENNIEGVTGYRCRTFEDYVRAIKNVQAGKIKSIDCRKKGEEFSLEAIAPMYENFFRKVTDISIGSGWYEIWDRSLYTQEYLDGQAKKTKNDEMKILYFGDLTAGAMGIIHRDIKKIIDKDYPDINFELMDWAGEKGYQDLFVNKEWKNWDMIIIDPYMSYILDTGWGFTALPKEEQLELKNKFIPVYHHEIDVPADHFNHGWYNDWFTTPVCSINPYIVNQIKDRGIESQLLPIGVSKEKFKPFKQVKQIKKVGFVGNTDKEDWRSIKRPEFFKDICEAAGIEPVIISGREHSWKMYEDIDAIICPSTAEGLPTYFAEAAACKIPFISTEVGIVRYYDKVKTFNTVSEAVDIINYLNESEENIEKYVNEVHDQMFPDRYWENILANHWVPYFNKMHKSKTENPKLPVSPWPVSSEIKRWYSENGDHTHNIDCDLTEDSIVFDVGGYSGEWAGQIYNKYNCTIYIFEPVKEFYDNIVKRFKGNDKVKVFHIGLGDKTYTTDIKITSDLVGSSIHRETGLTGKVESIEIVDIIEFIKEHKLESIDLLKLNIEGEEFPLLEHLIENNKLNLFNNLKIQFHNFMEFAEERKNNIRTHLQKEFNLVYDFFFVWEGWTIKK